MYGKSKKLGHFLVAIFVVALIASLVISAKRPPVSQIP